MKIIRIYIIVICVLFVNLINAQPIPPDHGGGGNNLPSGGGAPIDNGFMFLLCFSLIYLFIKYYQIKNKKNNIKELI